ncbi:P-loop NTPase fold protein [Hyalangium sp. s54d21]|uniref:P-loop NTPase fold protein n=2 Tax=Hyalangium rubrum TaxID=3103134 RepID=A0ABU5HBH5_9BACT|nr:P-loop NTPase fold protein [Hyalangium sp. s54d21]MDY7230611.1 P-loop NTPase fold protein [Hyalangium sp. s54d21]
MAANDAPGSESVRTKAHHFLKRILPERALDKSLQVARSASNALVTELLSKPAFDLIEVLGLFDATTIICIDDIERLSSKYPIDELLGIVNILSEHKGFDVVLVCNEEHLTSTATPGAQAYLRYKEKIVSMQHRIEPDLDAVFANLIQGFGDSLKENAQRHKEQILSLMRHCGSRNIRSLRRIIDHLATLYGLGIQNISGAHVNVLSALTLEFSEGQLEDAAFYDFNAMVMELSGRLSKRENEDEVLQKRRTFLKRFNLEDDYSFAPSLYALVRFGDIEDAALKLALNPPEQEEPQLSVTGAILSQLSKGEWRYWSDEQVRDLMDRVYAAAAHDKNLSAAEIIECLMYARLIAEMLAVELDSGVASSIKQRIAELATKGDESLSIDDPFLHMRYGDAVRHVNGEIQCYIDKRRQHDASKEMVRLVALLDAGDLVGLAAELRNSPNTTRLFVEQGGMAKFISIMRTNPHAIRAVVGFGNGLRALTGIWPEAEHHLNELLQALKDMRAHPEVTGRMHAWRAKHILREFGINE